MTEFFFNTIQEFNDYIGVKTLHPLVSVARVENTTPIQEAVHHYGLYALFLNETEQLDTRAKVGNDASFKVPKSAGAKYIKVEINMLEYWRMKRK